LLLTVTDSGIGIPPSDQARMFEKFERGTPRSGAGLGLSLVKSLIDLHGGAVTIDSAESRGTTITCRLPAGLRELAGMPPSPHIESRAAA
jgi:signal transduction histidine kinase